VGAAAAYSARAGLECYVFMPSDAPVATMKECVAMDAHLSLVDGFVNDAAKYVTDGREKFKWFELLTLKEPYRVEGKKTMGYEIAEQLEWGLPDVIVYPTGGGTGLIAMWKAFGELEQLGLIDGGKRPRMVCVQSSGCSPIVDAFIEGKESTEPFKNAHTIAGGLRVPSPYASEQMLRVLRESGGTAVKVDDSKILGSMRVLGREEGMFVCPEGAATLASLEQLMNNGDVEKSEKIVLYNTGSGMKYLEFIDLPELKVLPKGS
jgi:threonine synthase